MQARFSLTSQTSFGVLDNVGKFSYLELYTRILSLFRDAESPWCKETLAWWDMYVHHRSSNVLADLSFRQVYGVAPAVPIRGEEPEEETAADRLERRQKAERKARRQATSRARTRYVIGLLVLRNTDARGLIEALRTREARRAPVPPPANGLTSAPTPLLPRSPQHDHALLPRSPRRDCAVLPRSPRRDHHLLSLVSSACSPGRIVLARNSLPFVSCRRMSPGLARRSRLPSVDIFALSGF